MKHVWVMELQASIRFVTSKNIKKYVDVPEINEEHLEILVHCVTIELTTIKMEILHFAFKIVFFKCHKNS